MLANKGQTTENPQGGVHPSDGGIHWDDRGNWFLNIYELVSPSLSHEQVWDKINQDYQATRADGVQLQDQLERMSVDEPEETQISIPKRRTLQHRRHPTIPLHTLMVCLAPLQLFTI